MKRIVLRLLFTIGVLSVAGGRPGSSGLHRADQVWLRLVAERAVDSPGGAGAADGRGGRGRHPADSVPANSLPAAPAVTVGGRQILNARRTAEWTRARVRANLPAEHFLAVCAPVEILPEVHLSTRN